jgi:hypothetical protein
MSLFDLDQVMGIFRTFRRDGGPERLRALSVVGKNGGKDRLRLAAHACYESPGGSWVAMSAAYASMARSRFFEAM